MRSAADRSIAQRLAIGRFGGWWWLLLAGLILAFTQVIPMAYAVWLSLYDKEALEPTGTFVGLDNYVHLLTSPEFWESLQVGLIYGLGSVTLQVLLGLIGALLLHRTFKGRNLARSVVLLPFMIPTATVALMFALMFNNLYGIVNELLVGAGIIQEPLQFFGDPAWALPSVILVAAWCWSPFARIVFLARLQTIDNGLYESARTEGAGTRRQFLDITVPSLRGAIVLVVLLRGIWMFNKFDIPYLLTQGGPVHATRNLPIYAYEVNFLGQMQGQGAVLAVVMSLLLVMVAIPYFIVFQPEREVRTE